MNEYMDEKVWDLKTGAVLKNKNYITSFIYKIYIIVFSIIPLTYITHIYVSETD